MTAEKCSTSPVPRNWRGEIPPKFRPSTPAELEECLSNPMWRICSGYLYNIMIKGDENTEDFVIPFAPNRHQVRFLRRIWFRNVIPKARQIGYTTLICILFLDHALFNADQRCGIIAQDRDAAKVIFRDKVKLAYNKLPPELLKNFPLSEDNADEMVFDHNNSSIRVATSMRSGTIHRLHVSEFGKICAKYPDKAVEVMTGSIPSVPANGILIIESTAEGADGDFYEIVIQAKADADTGEELNKRQYRLHFTAWHENDEYRLPVRGIVVTPKDHAYFDAVEARVGTKIDAQQRAWYCATRDADFRGKPERMWQEYPSFLEECFQVSTEGCYYVNQMTALRTSGRIAKTLPVLPGIPCMTFWDIGSSDGTAIWVVQPLGTEYRCIRFYEAWGESYEHATQWLQSLGVTFSTMFLPHDAEHVRQGQTSNKSPRDMLTELMPGVTWEIVPRIQDVNWGINQTRNLFPLLCFDETHTKEGLAHLQAYRKKWNQRQACWSDEPDKAGGHSEGADALRMLAQAYAGGMLNLSRQTQRKRKSNWRTA